MNRIFMKMVQKSTNLSMELTEQILRMKHANGNYEDYDYAISLVKEIHKNQMELIEKMYIEENEDRVEIPEFINVG